MANWSTVSIPFNGVYRPLGDTYNPLLTNGTCNSMEGWRIKNGSLMLTEGLAAGLVNQSYFQSQPVQWLDNYASSYYYVTNRELRKVAASESQISSTFMASSPTTRLTSVQFRGMILVASETQGLRWINPATDAFRTVGITAPTSSPTVAAGSAGLLTGVYKYCVTFVDDQGNESNTYLTNGIANYGTVTVTEKQISLSAIPTGGAGVLYRRIYRTISQGEQFLYLTQINDNTTTTYTDNNEDTSLGSPLQYDNTNPISTIRQIFTSGQRIYLVDGSDGRTLWASKIDPFTATPDWQHYPTTLSIKLPFDATNNPFQAGFELNSFIYAASRRSIYRILGDADTGVSVKKALDDGLFGKMAFVMLPNKVAYVSSTRRLKLWDGETEPVDIGSNVQYYLSQMLEDTGLYNVSLVFDEEENFIQVYFNTSGGLKAIRVDLSTGNAWDVPTSIQIPLFDKYTKGILGTIVGNTTIMGESGYKNQGSRYATQTAEWHGITPAPGKDCYFGRIKLECKATPIVSFVPPTLKVEWSVNDSPFFTTKYVDLSRDNLSPSGGPKKVTYVPIHRRGETLKIKVSSVDNNASLNNNVEIYQISIEVEGAQSKQDHRSYPVDKEQ